MALSPKAQRLAAKVSTPGTKMGDLKTLGKEIGKDHGLAMELWSTGALHARLLATLVFGNVERQRLAHAPTPVLVLPGTPALDRAEAPRQL